MNIIDHHKIEHFLEDELIIYLRKSRSDNPNESVEEVLERHEKELQEYALREFGYKIPEKNIYREVVSGETIDDRPELLKVLNRMEKGNVKGVLVIEPQRLSRGDLLDCGRIIQAFQYTNTLILTPMKTYDLEEKYDRKFFEMELLRGNDYLEYTKEILSRGRLRSVKDGKAIMSVAPFGYSKKKIPHDKGYMLIPKKDEADTVIMIYEMFIEGLGTSNLANYLNKIKAKARKADIWTPAMVRNILTNPVYYGYLTWEKRKNVNSLYDGKIITKRPVNEKHYLVKGIHDPLISEEMFFTVQDILKSNANPKIPKHKEIRNPIAGLVYCGVCGRAMVRRPYNKKLSKKPKLKHDIDKQEFSNYLREYKDKSKLSLKDISDKLEVSKNSIDSWFSKDLNKFYVSPSLIENWTSLKKLLGIKRNKYDKLLSTFEDDEPRQETLICSLSHCSNVSSDLELVERRIIESLEIILKDYKYFLDNYEEEYGKEVKNNAKILSKIEKEIELLNKELKNARRSYNREEFSFEEYQEIKKEVEEELKDLEEEKEVILNSQADDKVIRYKKSIPILENCVKEYYSLDVLEKNQVLKSIIEKVVYTKKVGGRWNKKARDDFKIELFLKL